MASNEITLNRVFEGVVDSTFEEADREYRSTAFEFYSRVVQRTPVKTGRARGNWGLTDKSQPTGTVGPNKNDGRGADVTSRDLSPITLYNNLEYITELERGSSNKAPQGMVAVSAAELGIQLEGEF